MFYAIFDVVGMVFFATGVMWFSKGQTLFISNFPTNLTEALLALVGGLLLMLWAAAQILRELLTRPPDNLQEGN